MFRKISVAALLVLSFTAARADAPGDVCKFFNAHSWPCSTDVTNKIINLKVSKTNTSAVSMVGSIFRKQACNTLLKGIDASLAVSTELAGWSINVRTADTGKIIAKCHL